MWSRGLNFDSFTFFKMIPPRVDVWGCPGPLERNQVVMCRVIASSTNVYSSCYPFTIWTWTLSCSDPVVFWVKDNLFSVMIFSSFETGNYMVPYHFSSHSLCLPPCGCHKVLQHRMGRLPQGVSPELLSCPCEPPSGMYLLEQLQRPLDLIVTLLVFWHLWTLLHRLGTPASWPWAWPGSSFLWWVETRDDVQHLTTHKMRPKM